MKVYGTRTSAMLALLASCVSVAGQSNANNPVLHRRALNSDEDIEAVTRSTGRTRLPLDASGEYALGGNGRIDVELQSDHLSGFISRLGDRESDAGEPLTFFFATSQLSGQHLAFTTRQVHGTWFSFEGTIVRGSRSGSGASLDAFPHSARTECRYWHLSCCRQALCK